MKKQYNEFTIGLVVTIALFIVIAGILWLNKSNFLESGLHIKMKVQDAHGIAVGDEVVYKGLSVGTLQSAHLVKDGVILELKIITAKNIPDDSRFTIRASGLLGGHIVEIQPGTSSTYLQNGTEVMGFESIGLLDIVQHGSQLNSKLNNILANIDSLSDASSAHSIYTTLDELNQTSRTLHFLLKENQNNLKDMITNLQEMSEKNKEPLHRILTNISQKSENLANTIEHTQQLAAKIDTLINKIYDGEGSLGRLILDESLYNNMNKTFIHLDSLIQAIHKNPKKFIGVKVF